MLSCATAYFNYPVSGFEIRLNNTKNWLFIIFTSLTKGFIEVVNDS